MNTYERALALVNSDPELCKLVKKLMSPRFSVPAHKRPMTLTRNMRDLYQYIKDYTEANDGVSPSYDEMRAHMGLVSKSGIHRLINSLEERGHIHRLRHHARAIVCIEQEVIPVEEIA